MNENQQHQDSMTTLSKCLIRDDDDKQFLNQLPDPISSRFSTLTVTYRPMSGSFVLEESICRTISQEIESTAFSPSPIRSSNLIDSAFFQLKSTTCSSDNHFVHQPCIDTDIHINNTLNTNNCNNSLDSSTGTNAVNETPVNECNVNSFRRSSKHRRMKSSKKSKEIEQEFEHAKDIDQSAVNSSTEIYEYKSPFSKEYDQAISLQGQIHTNSSVNEWNLKDFYRDVKTQLEPETNTKPVFEKCLKLARNDHFTDNGGVCTVERKDQIFLHRKKALIASITRLQANTIKWEHRRHHNETIYNRLIKNATLDTNNILTTNGNFSSKTTNEKDIRDINDLKRELGCSECKRLACVGNCAPAHEYHQYKRLIPFSSLSHTRDQIPSKLHLRTQRSAIDLRPRTTQSTTRGTKLNPVVVVPLFQDESQVKRSQKKFTNGFLPGKLIRSQRRETLAFI